MAAAWAQRARKKKENSALFDLNQFVEDCKGKRASAVNEALEEALRDSESLKKAFDAVAPDGSQSRSTGWVQESTA